MVRFHLSAQPAQTKVEAYFEKALRVLGDLWVCSYPSIAVVALILLVFATPQGPEISRDYHRIFSTDPLATLTPAGTNRLMAFGFTIVAVGYCTLAIFFACVSALGRVRHQDSTVAYWLALLCVLSSLGMIFGDGIALGLIGVTIGVFLLMPFFEPSTVAFHTALGVHAHRIALALLAIGGVIAIIALMSPVWFPRTVTTWPIVYSAVGFWTLFWTLLVISWPRSCRRPSFWYLPIIVVLIFSRCNDDHELRKMANAPTPAPRPAQTLSPEYVGTWLAQRCPKPSVPCRIRFIAAHGGGQRAAYWTQAVLSELPGRKPDGFQPLEFDRSVFAFSGVSGGSLGGLSYYLARDSGVTDWQNRLDEAAASDNLSPLVAGLLYREMIQAFWPSPLPFLDRARPYEQGIEDKWNWAFPRAKPGTRMSDAFPPDLADAPSLFLNSAVVESGERFVNSSLTFPLKFRPDAVYAADNPQIVASPITNSTAAHLSARFAYINPYATLHNRDGKWERLVDGGYNEGTGLLTLLEVVDAFRDAHARCAACPKKIAIEITYIANDPRAEDHLDGTPAEQPSALPERGKPCPGTTPPPKAGEEFAWELLTPVTGVIHAHYNALASALRYRLHEYQDRADGAKAPVAAYRVISLKRMVEAYSSGALGTPPDDWCSQYARWEPALGWWLSEHSLQQMSKLLKARDAQGRSLLDLTKPRSASAVPLVESN